MMIMRADAKLKNLFGHNCIKVSMLQFVIFYQVKIPPSCYDTAKQCE